ncbi:DUF5372 family protein [Pontiella desulfatans]|uniref:DUF5372 family protein n=1 Tax=Pontiella desulfatans TaxID=2750659 RepID=UPI00109C61A7
MQSTAPHGEFEAQTFCVTHPFHPLAGRLFPVVEVRRNWSEECVYFRNGPGRLASIPLAWTSLSVLDPFFELSEGLALFRCEDLLALVRYLDSQREVGDDNT